MLSVYVKSLVHKSCLLQIESKRLSWNAESKIGSLEKANHKPAGGEVKVKSYLLP